MSSPTDGLDGSRAPGGEQPPARARVPPDLDTSDGARLEVLVMASLRDLGEDGSRRASDSVATALREAAAARGLPERDVRVTVLSGRQVTRDAVLRELSRVSGALAAPRRRAIVYYFGHGRSAPDRAPLDEDDGRDELWAPWVGPGVVDDDISACVRRAQIHRTSLLTLFSDSCSSGSMIDARVAPDTNWATVSSCSDSEDALAASDGGVFTLFGLLPTLAALTAVRARVSVRKLATGAARRVQVPGQRVTLATGAVARDPPLSEWDIFAVGT